jgi:hypothetical protein
MTPRIAPWRAIILAGLISLNAGLVAVAGSALLSDDPAAPPPVGWTPPVGTISRAPNGTNPIAHYRQTLARPIFFKTREPFVPPPPPRAAPVARISPPPVVADPGLMIGGVMMMQGVRRAYLYRKTDPSGTWVAYGEEFMGWKIQTIDATGIVLGNGERKIDLKLYPDH